jgi:hypothetical protein
MHIPLGGTQKGVISTSSYDKNDAWFIPEDSGGHYEYCVRKGGRIATYEEFKELYPYKNRHPRNRSKERTKHNAVYNKRE